MGDSPSSFKQVSHSDYHLISPKNFSLKLDHDDAIAESCPENTSDKEKSSGDLSIAEEAKVLQAFADYNAEGTLDSQRDRIAGLKLLNSILKPDQIRIYFTLSPTKCTSIVSGNQHTRQWSAYTTRLRSMSTSLGLQSRQKFASNCSRSVFYQGSAKMTPQTHAIASANKFRLSKLKD